MLKICTVQQNESPSLSDRNAGMVFRRPGFLSALVCRALLPTSHRPSVFVSWDRSIRTPSEPDLLGPDLSILLSVLLFVSRLLHIHSTFQLQTLSQTFSLSALSI